MSSTRICPLEDEARSAAEIVHDDCREHCAALFRRLMAGEDVGLLKITLRAKDGHPVFAEGHATVRFKDGKPVTTPERSFTQIRALTLQQ